MKKTQNWRINNQIRGNEVRVIGSDNKQIGVLNVREALKKAKEEGLDLVEIAPKAKPPVVRIVDFGKFRYSEEKKLKEQAKKAKASELKEIRFSPFIAEGDYNTRMRRVNTFLKQGNKVRTVVVFKGRHMRSKTFGYELLKKILTELESEIVVDMEPKFLGRHLAMVISPVKKIKSDTKKLTELTIKGDLPIDETIDEDEE